MKEIAQLKYTRSQEQIFIASALSSVVSTFITNPLEVAKLNLQYFPLNCKYYPHQSTHGSTQATLSFSLVSAPNSVSMDRLKVSKLPFHKSLLATCSSCRFTRTSGSHSPIIINLIVFKIHSSLQSSQDLWLSL